MKSVRRVLIEVRNPDLANPPGVRKAVHVARLLGASVELFHAISMAGSGEAGLKDLARRVRRLGVPTSWHQTRDFPRHEAIMRRAERIRADLIIAECPAGERPGPRRLHLTAWELLRHSPRPVLLLKNDRKWREPVILAAVDPSHAHAKPARLDEEIVAQAANLCRALDVSLELVHANFPTAFGLAAIDAALDGATLARVYDEQQARSQASFERFARRMRVPKIRCHLLDTAPDFAIPELARELGADVVVMGVVSRSGLKGALIGNTAERVLDALPCDVLIVKPSQRPRRKARSSHDQPVATSPALIPPPA